MNLRLDGSKIRGVRPGEGAPVAPPRAPKKESLIPIEPPTIVGYIFVIRSEYGLVRLEATTKPKAAFEKMRSRVTFRLEVAFLCFLRVDCYRQAEEAAREALERHRVNSAWFDCAPDVAIAAIRAAAKGLGAKMVQTGLADVDDSLRRAEAWTEAARSGQLRFRRRHAKLFAAALNGLGTGLLGVIVRQLSPDLHPALTIGPCLLFGLVLALVIDRYQRSIPPI